MVMHTFDPNTLEAKADQSGLRSEFHRAHSQTLYRDSPQNYFKIGHKNRQKFLKRRVAAPPQFTFHIGIFMPFDFVLRGQV